MRTSKDSRSPIICDKKMELSRRNVAVHSTHFHHTNVLKLHSATANTHTLQSMTPEPYRTSAIWNAIPYCRLPILSDVRKKYVQIR